MRRRSRLDQLYDALNREFFRARLPPYTVRLGYRLGYGFCDTAHRRILLRSGLSESTVPTARHTLRQTLLHEMCHIGTRYHGKRWQAKMLRLADRGETWARDEAREYQREAPPFGARVKHVLEDYCWARVDGVMTWRRALTAVAREFGLTPGEFVAKAPWARRAWDRLVEDRRSVDAEQERFEALLEGGDELTRFNTLTTC
jgi:hypothetical protein